MIGLVTPREVFGEMIRAAKKDKDAPQGGLGMLYKARMRCLERGLLDMAMTSSALDALMDELIDEATKPEPAIDYDRIHGKRGKDWIIQ